MHTEGSEDEDIELTAQLIGAYLGKSGIEARRTKK